VRILEQHEALEPRGQRFAFGATYLSDRETGIVETYGPHFAASLRQLARSARIEEVEGLLWRADAER
jgi:hypothetical protein